MRSVWVIVAWVGCSEPTDPGSVMPTDTSIPTTTSVLPPPSEPVCGQIPAPPSDSTLPLATFIPHIRDGEVFLGVGGSVSVSEVPEGATVELYTGTRLLNHACTAPCSGLVDPVLVTSAVADASGAVRFEIDGDYEEPQVIMWEAMAIDPADPLIVAYSDAIVRHVAWPMFDSPVQLENVTNRAGLTETFTLGNTHTGGVAFVDANNDYLPDIYIVSGSGTSNHLYMNLGGGMFVDEPFRAQKPNPQIECSGVTFGDLENDGDLDLFVTVDNPQQMISFLPQPIDGGPNLLFVNDGTGHFEERGVETGFVDPRGWRNSNNALADYDLDGCLDVYTLQWAMAAEPGADNFDRLLHNNCDGTFTDVTTQLGLDPFGRDGLGLLWWDADFDLFPELYVANNSDRCDQPVFDPEHDYWKNVGGTAFENWTHRSDPTVGWDGWAGMGMDVGDIDGDGTWDLYMTDVWYLPPDPQGNVLYLGNPDGTLSPNVCQEKGVCYGYNSWPTNFMDFDNDGWVDLWVGASVASDPSLMFVNKGDGSGEFWPARVEGWIGSITRAGVSGDYDADGDVDVFIWSEGSESTLWMNTGLTAGAPVPPDRHWIELRLVGTQSNRAAIGARIELVANGQRQMRRVSGGDSAHSQTDLAVHFGLGTDTIVESIDVYWPSGVVQQFTDVQADRFWLLDEDAGLLDELTTESLAVWDPGAGTLRVEGATSYRGRTTIEAVGLGSLTYDLATQRFGATFSTSRPDEVQLRTATGGQVTVTVTDL